MRVLGGRAPKYDPYYSRITKQKNALEKNQQSAQNAELQ